MADMNRLERLQAEFEEKLRALRKECDHIITSDSPAIISAHGNYFYFCNECEDCISGEIAIKEDAFRAKTIIYENIRAHDGGQRVSIAVHECDVMTNAQRESEYRKRKPVKLNRYFGKPFSTWSQQ